MLSWLVENIATIFICAGLLAVVTAVVLCMIRNKRKGSSCTGGCAGCPMNGACHTEK